MAKRNILTLKKVNDVNYIEDRILGMLNIYACVPVQIKIAEMADRLTNKMPIEQMIALEV